MSLTEEQIAKLKPGDPLIITGTFVEICSDGDIKFETKWTNANGRIYDVCAITHPSSVSLPGEAPEKPKYDPCRKFRKGDKVRFKEHLGRRSLAHCDKIVTLDCDEKYGQCCWSEMYGNGDIIHRNVYFCFLELVTPVEDQDERYEYIVCRYNDQYQVRKQLKTKQVIVSVHNIHSYPDNQAAFQAAMEKCYKLNKQEL